MHTHTPTPKELLAMKVRVERIKSTDKEEIQERKNEEKRNGCECRTVDVVYPIFDQHLCFVRHEKAMCR